MRVRQSAIRELTIYCTGSAEALLAIIVYELTDTDPDLCSTAADCLASFDDVASPEAVSALGTCTFFLPFSFFRLSSPLENSLTSLPAKAANAIIERSHSQAAIFWVPAGVGPVVDPSSTACREELMLNPGDFRGYLLPRTFAHLRESCQALAERQYLSSAIWGAVFLEAILDDLAETLKLPAPGQDDLNGRIQQFQQFLRNRGGLPIAIPEEIIKRCHDIRNTRNRLVHDMGMAKTTLAEDAQFMNAGIKVILDWYKTVSPVRTVEANVALRPPEPGVRVFVSTISPHSPSQEYFLDELMERLRNIGIEPVRCVTSVYDNKDPIGKVRRTIESCLAMIVVGLERTHAYFLRDKEGAPDQGEETHRQYTSGWLHVEAGIANALGLEVFVLCQKSIHGDGIFDRRWNTYPVAEIDSLDMSSTQLESFLKHVQSWVIKGQAEKGAAADGHRTSGR